MRHTGGTLHNLPYNAFYLVYEGLEPVLYGELVYKFKRIDVK